MSHRRLLSPKDVEDEGALKASTLAKWRMRGYGPRYVKVGGRVFYPEDELDRWLESRLRTSTTDDGSGLGRMA